jgi:SAM-dependent methyltransferase
LALDYLIPESMIGHSTVLLIDLNESGKLRFEADFNFLSPHYRPLLSTREVLHREHIYGSGPPNATVHPEVLELAKQLKGPLLDFGCGRGALIGELQQLGIEAYGLELDSAIIRESIPRQRIGAIVLYDGSFPAPFEDGRFRSIMCSEVLEHVPDYQSAIRDIARLAIETVIFTVPDMSAIPIGFRHGAVPWHLLEGTHVNFFTQQSLKQALQAHFSKIEFGRVGLSHFNGSMFYVSLVAVCSK